MDQHQLAIVMIFGIPIVAIIGGITAGIVKMIGRQRLIELAHRERIAAIERGADLSKLVPLPGDNFFNPRQATLQRAQGLLIGGCVVLAVGISLALMLLLLPSFEARGSWPVGLIPIFVGIALLFSARVVRRAADQETAPPRV